MFVSTGVRRKGGGVSVLVDAAHAHGQAQLSGMTAISGFVLTKCIDEQDSGSAKIWVTVFGATSLVAAWSFWRLV
jgi:hypothetical protein